MFSRLCLVPQSGQIIVALSILESAGAPWYSPPQTGQVFAMFSEFFISYTSFAQIECKPQMLQMESEITVALNAGSDVKTAWNPQRSVLVHDVHKGCNWLRFSVFVKFDRQFHFLFVVEIRISLVGIKTAFVGFGNLPDCNGNFGFFGFLNGEVGACFAALEKQLIAMNPCCADGLCIRAAVFHLLYIEI